MVKFSFKQQVFTGFAISLLFVLFTAVTSYLSVKSLRQDATWQNHTYEVINTTERINLELANAESSLRGYLLTNIPRYLDPYQNNSSSVLLTMKELSDLVADNPVQSQKVDSMEVLLLQKLSIMRETLLLKTSSGTAAAHQKVSAGEGKAIMDQIQGLINDLVRTEKILLIERTETTNKASDRTITIIVGSCVIIFGLILFLFSYIKRTFNEQKNIENQIRKNNRRLSQLSEENKEKNLLLSGVAKINEVMRGDESMDVLSARIITEICNFIQAPVGLLFLYDRQKEQLNLAANYAYDGLTDDQKSYRIGEGLVGQTALEKEEKIFNDVPADYLTLKSGLGSSTPQCIGLYPIVFNKATIAVLEIGFNRAPDNATRLYLTTISEIIAIALNSTEGRLKQLHLFDQLQVQTAELQTQQEELRTINEELTYKSEQLEASEEELRVQQEELRQTNAEIEEKAEQLAERNEYITQAREAMRVKAKELALSNQYKSEFLANMSHELRTPLNSILILARILKENKPLNLNEDQVKYAGVIQNAGTDLLNLINDILDLSKIESGKIDLDNQLVSIEEIKQHTEALFSEVAKSKNIEFQTTIAANTPAQLVTDSIRTEQIIKNLLSNAFKFTPAFGKISLDIRLANADQNYFNSSLTESKQVIAFMVTDSGIGIAADKQKLIFEAFQQADGSTSRTYGGTGLGLSISKELAYILGGEIQLESQPGIGSTFTLFLPQSREGLETPVEKQPERATEVVALPLKDNPVLLIVEDDEVFADFLKDHAIAKGFNPILAFRGDTALNMASEHLPDAIILDIMLPDMNGWTVLKKLKADERTASIPVHLMSAGDQSSNQAYKEGAIGFLKKPIAKDQLDQAFANLNQQQQIDYDFKKVLLIEDQELQSMVVKEELLSKGVAVAQAFSGQQALDLLETENFDCIILDINLPDIYGIDLLDQIKAIPRFSHIPVVINTAMELDQDKLAHIMQYTEAMVLKSMKSNNRLIDEVSLFINKLKKEENGKQDIALEKVFQGKTILITDDDMRNVFALSSALQDYNLNIVMANNGQQALDKLKETHIDLVLMDIMMPGMNGYEAMQAIRQQPAFKNLPIIALTAKAMKQDREKCIEAGANDYISKPVDLDKLLSMMRVWLS
ncbi:CheY-like chemotaxis protein/signal transduction histidine kinase/CHASE3 domain sensor protein [Pedobacter sp. CAN_A7]|uniref:response regulator n=1 Tax=Pedobacter sp. CAN_A7 TaxID=2787722 RepID=UPI0018CBAAD0